MNYKIGPDPDFPYLSETEFFEFPDPAAISDDIICIGGNLSPGMLLSAYKQGIFPWFNPGDPLLWQSPDPRFVIYPETLHISNSMKKVLKNNNFDITFDTNFEGVMRGCAEIYRPDQSGITWITDDMIAAYTELHRLGWAHSAEAWQNGCLLGGCYGLKIGNVFFGESMFAKKSNASKAAFLTLAQNLFVCGTAFIDCQVPSEHVKSLGGSEISRHDFLQLLRKTLTR